MIQRVGRYTLSLDDARLASWASAAGKKEAEGPLGTCFDETFSDNSLGQESWEKAEAMQDSMMEYLYPIQMRQLIGCHLLESILLSSLFQKAME